MKTIPSLKYRTSQTAFIALALAAATSFASCQKWLEEKPQSSFAASSFFNSPEEATMAVLGAYEPLSSQQTFGFYISLAYDIDSDIAQMAGLGFTNDVRIVAHYGISPAHPMLYQTWSLLYKGINRANLVLESISQMPLYQSGSDAQKEALRRLLGEAKFLRGFYYSELVRLFGDVPFKTKTTEASDSMKLPRTDRYMIYDQILSDLKEAAEVIPWTKQNDERISKGAVKGMLARIALAAGGYSLRQNGQMERPANYKEYYTLAQQQTKEIMESGAHALNASYEQVFKNHCKHILEPKESMFEVAFFNAIGESGHSGYIGTWNAPVADQGNPYGRANSFYKTTALFQKSYPAGDLRRDVAVATYKIDINGAQVQLTGSGDAQWAPGKWRRDWQVPPAKDLNNTDLNWCVLRYADVLLMRAEAENELNEGPNAAAYEAINRVRRRAYGKPLNVADASADLPAGLDKQGFFAKLKQERAWELCFEGMRKADLIRWNSLGSSLRATEAALKAYRSSYPYQAGTNFTDNKHELYPIPAAEFEVNGNLKQNPNY
ncbi:RagB/SusD family nutrient uptake outer membrane protein [Paraflavisolibacter sp. H34]|uniref:RagB/SusD family nutrient uptake outer membrane protein n=1 Tax=Huijunlia imazamoxiresistens TaxID=3127457 RepID=UPI0030189B6F